MESVVTKARVLPERSKPSALSVGIGQERWPLIALDQSGFAVEDPSKDGNDTAGLEDIRGRVDIFDGDRLLGTALVVLDRVTEGAVRYRFKVHSPARLKAPLDFAQEEHDAALASAI